VIGRQKMCSNRSRNISQLRLKRLRLERESARNPNAARASLSLGNGYELRTYDSRPGSGPSADATELGDAIHRFSTRTNFVDKISRPEPVGTKCRFDS